MTSVVIIYCNYSRCTTERCQSHCNALAEVCWKYYLLLTFLTSINIPLVLFTSQKLKEIGGKFGDNALVNLNQLSSEEKKALNEAIEAENMGPKVETDVMHAHQLST